MSQIRPLIPLLVTAGILIGGNGLQGTYIALRGISEGFSASTIGLISAAYSVGFALGCISVTQLMRRIGHIRTFATMAAVASAASIAMPLVIHPVFWMLMRFVIGIAVACLFAVIESWINAQVTNSNRARTLSIYRFVDLGSVTLAQYIIPIAGIGGPVVFSLIAMALSLSLVPISLADKSNPAPPKQIPFNLFAVWRISPLAVVGCVAVGLSMAAFRNIGPIYAEQIGLSVTAIATFMSAGIIGGVVLQYPLGVYSDRYDRRIIILATTAGSVIVGLFLAFFAGTDEWSNIIGVFVFGAFALPLYSLSSAHGNDHAREGEHAMMSAGLLFFWSVGATVGPLLASLLIDQFGPKALFSYTAAIQVVFIAYTIYRLQVREGVPVEERNWRFRSLLRTSAYFQKLAAPAAPKKDGPEPNPPEKNDP
ncbi:putative MFS-type transporter YcaD [Rhizobium rhizogenes]|uniref:MFS transporter n=2 Tax=Rhizobium/Agrobacterium group TaxID=227290 RepID=A0A546Y8I4_AGRTU|nr:MULTISPECIES: MFS transporter [Rhizobium/Agrobacterium group]AQS62133.1 MFS transporter [Rhizobium rhizogenes]MBO0128103.1 MFS transporter [Agrobacterium sp. OT33]MCZ7442602.1 MFS transporter [Rhizobium rhizogenes]NSX90303.1 MFS transporter [Agrobacterium tumefaciens]NSZ78594.1 MFS transporter [Agrobacterium tumefaciens]